MNKVLNRTELGNYDISFIGQHSNIQSDSKDSLISLPKNIRLLDLMIGVNWTNPSERSRLQISFGKTITLGATASFRLSVYRFVRRFTGPVTAVRLARLFAGSAA